MSRSVKQLLTATFGLIALFLILSRSTGFAQALRAGTSSYVQGVKVLQGR